LNKIFFKKKVLRVLNQNSAPPDLKIGEIGYGFTAYQPLLNVCKLLYGASTRQCTGSSYVSL